MDKYYRFPLRADAIALNEHIEDHPNMPIVGNVNGTPAPNNQEIEQWFEAPLDCEDGLSAVREIPDYFFNEMGVDASEKASIIATYVTGKATIEDYDHNWVPSDDSLTNIALGSTVTAKSEQGENIATNVIDQDGSTYWRGNDDPQWIMFQLSSPQTVVRFAIRARRGKEYAPRAIGFPRNFVLQGSNNGADWTNLADFNNERFAPKELIRFRVPVANRGSYLYYRIRITLSANTGNTSIAEVRLLTNA